MGVFEPEDVVPSAVLGNNISQLRRRDGLTINQGDALRLEVCNKRGETGIPIYHERSFTDAELDIIREFIVVFLQS